MGSFHIIICVTDDVFVIRRFGHSTIVGLFRCWWRMDDTSALNGDVKQVIYLHKHIYEAILRTKFRCSGNVLSEITVL